MRSFSSLKYKENSLTDLIENKNRLRICLWISRAQSSEGDSRADRE